ncbi:MAG: NAD(P)-dependent oxidoreductase [Acutalibacteraceae bacterium]|nr:NAD(P)-dependent oxidoreductase [Acutalibacteraceae bacterium]
MNLLVTGALGCSDAQKNMLKALSENFVFLQNESDTLPCDYESIDTVVCNGLFLHHPIDKFKKLKNIQLTSAGLDRVDCDYVLKKGININNARGVYSVPMAEFAVFGVLELYKKGFAFYKNKEKRLWEKQRDLIELSGKVVSVVGCGSVGQECAKRFSAFGCKVLGVDINCEKNALFEKIYPIGELDDVLKISDVVILTLPLTESTTHLFNAQKFAAMKDNSVLVNISRGAVVDTKAMIVALKNKLFGAVLDVFEQEPLDATSELWELDNTIITPHNSFVGENNNQRLFNTVYKFLKELV